VAKNRNRLPVGFIILLAALTALGPLTINLYLPALPQISDELGAGPGQAQLTMTTVLVGLAAGQLLLGTISDATGRRRPLAIALGLYTVFSLAIAAAQSVELLIVLRFFQGALGAAGMVIAMAVVRDSFDGLRVARAISRLMLVVGVAPVLAPALGSQLMLLGSWRLMFVVLAVAALVLLVFVLFVLDESLPPEARRAGGTVSALRAYGRLLRDRTFAGLVLIVGFIMAGHFTYITSSTFVFQEFYEVSPQLYGLLFGVGSLVVTAGTQISGALVGRVTPVRILAGALAVAATGAVATIITVTAVGTGPGGLAWFMVALLPTIGAVGVCFPTVAAVALARQERDAGSAASLIGASQFGMAALGPPLSGLVGDSPVRMAVIMLVMFVIAGSAVLAVARGLRSLS